MKETVTNNSVDQLANKERTKKVLSPTVLAATRLLEMSQFVVLSSGETLRERLSRETDKSCRDKISEAEQKVNTPVVEIVEQLTNELTTELEDKLALLERRNGNENDGTSLADYIYRLRKKIEIVEAISDCQTASELNQRLAETRLNLINQKWATDLIKDFTSFNKLLLYIKDKIYAPSDQELVSILQQLSAFESLTKTIGQRIGDTKDAKILEVLTTEAARRRRILLSNDLNENEVPLVNSSIVLDPMVAEVSKLLSDNQQAETVTPKNLLNFCETDKSAEELSGELTKLYNIFPEAQETIANLLLVTFAISSKREDNEINKTKQRIITLITPIINDLIGVELKKLYNDSINSVARAQVTFDDLVAICKEQQQKEVTSKFTQMFAMALGTLNIPESQKTNFLEENKERLQNCIIAYYDLLSNANDEFLNPLAVMSSITRAVFLNQPVDLVYVRSLRWCYPNGEVEIPPTAGDWVTKDVKGNEIVRKEWVEREKLIRYRDQVILPLTNNNIPVSSATLLSTGDYEMTGPGYGFLESDQRAVNAREYVADVRNRLSAWKIFENTLPAKIITVKDFIRDYGTDQFQQILGDIERRFDAMRQNGDLSFCGYTSEAVEWWIEKEDNNRNPFISWWTWERSRDFTRYKITFEMALGCALADSGKNILMTVSGNRASGLPLSKSRQINEALGEIGITAIKSINDGDQSKTFSDKTTVVT